MIVKRLGNGLVDGVCCDCNDRDDMCDDKVVDDVNAPSHYTSGLYETIDEMLILFGIEETMSFCKLNSWKYRSRCGLKEGQDSSKDKAKSDWYIDKYNQLARYKNNNDTEPFSENIFMGLKPKNLKDISICI